MQSTHVRRQCMAERRRGLRGIVALAPAAAFVCGLLATPPQASAQFQGPQLTAFTVTPGDGKVTPKRAATTEIPWAEVEYVFGHWNTRNNDLGGEKTCDTSVCHLRKLMNGATYRFERRVRQEIHGNAQAADVSNEKITVFATPTAW